MTDFDQEIFERHAENHRLMRGADMKYSGSSTDVAALIAYAQSLETINDALVKALEVLLEEATNFGASGVYFDEECMGHKGPQLARDALALVGILRGGDK